MKIKFEKQEAIISNKSLDRTKYEWNEWAIIWIVQENVLESEIKLRWFTNSGYNMAKTEQIMLIIS